MTDRSAFQTALHRLRAGYENVLSRRAQIESKGKRGNSVVRESYETLASEIQGSLEKLDRAECCDKNNVASWFGRGVLPGHAYLLAMLDSFFENGHVGDLSEEEFIHAYNVTAEQRGRAVFRPSQHARATDVQRWRNLVFPAIDRIHLIPLFIQSEPFIETGFTDMKVELSDQRLLVAQPDWFHEVGKRSGFATNEINVGLDGENDWREFEARYGFLGLDRASIMKEADKFARFIANDLDDPSRPYKIYNRPKLGVLGLNFLVPADGRERQAVKLRLFETDYFTHKTFQGLITRVLEDRPDCFDSLDTYPVTNGQLLNYFSTSIGINISLVSTYTGVRRLILGRLSNNNMNFPDRGKVYLVANEGVNLDDLEMTGEGIKRFSLTRSIERCLDEEAGLPRNRILRASIEGLFIVRKNFELGIHIVVETDASPEDIRRYRTLARDARRELRSNLFAVDLDYGSLCNFIEYEAGGLDQMAHYLPALIDAVLVREEKRQIPAL